MTRPTNRLRRLAAAAALTTLLAACGGGSGDEPEKDPAAVGKQALPGPVPTNVAFAPAPKDGMAAPQATLTLVDGTEVALADYWKDRPVVLVFFSTWCQWCLDNQAELNALATEQGDAALVVGIAGEEKPEEVTAYAAKHGVTHPLATDPGLDVWRTFAVTEPPLVAVVAPGGKLVRGWPGGVEVETIKSTLRGFRSGS